MPKYNTSKVTLVGTPEMVGSWIFYPAWLCMPNIIPKGLILDYKDVRRCYQEAESNQANPYDIISWDSLEEKIQSGYLVCNDPKGPNLFDKGSIPVYYEDFITRNELKESASIAKRIASKLAKEEKELIILEGYRNWKKFGLELKRYFKNRDPLFNRAIDQTNIQIKKIENGTQPIDSKKLIIRYLLKLMVGLRLRKIYSRLYKKRISEFVVFDTPEYLPAAKLLSKHLNLSMSNFAIPTAGPERNEMIIKEIFKIDESKRPLMADNLELLYSAVEEINAKINQYGIEKINEIETELREEVTKLKKRIRSNKILHLAGITTANIPTLYKTAESIIGGRTNELTPFLLATIGSTIFYVLLSKNDIKEIIEESSNSAKFVLSRELVNSSSKKVGKKWIDNIVRLSRMLTPRPITADRISRQMMEPWIANKVWYDYYNV